MSIPTAGNDHDSIGDLISPERANELDRDAAIEKRDAGAKVALVPNLLSRFSLIPSRGIDTSAPLWQRRNDWATIAITPGLVFDKGTRMLIPGRIPSGGLANLSFLWCVNQVRINIAREVDDPSRIDLGDTLADYLRGIGIAKGGKQYSQARQAMQSVLGASIQLHQLVSEDRDGMPGQRHRMVKVDVATSYDLWEPTGNELEGFRPYAVASPMLMQLAADDNAVPVRMDLLARFADSVLAQQALNWLANQVYYLDVSGKPAVEASWDDLYRNITHNTADPEKFRTAWKKAVLRVTEEWPEIKPHLDLSARPENPVRGSGQRRVIRLTRGARPLVMPKRLGGAEAGSD